MNKRVLLNIAVAALLSAGLYVTAAPAPAAHAARNAIVMRMSGPSAMADFSGTDANGITWDVMISVSTQGEQLGPTPISGPAVGVSIIEFNASGMQLNGFGLASVPGLTIDGKGLTAAFLPATSVEIGPTGDNPGAFPPFVAEVGPVSWTGEGAITFSSETFHFRIPHVGSVSVHSTSKSRMATATGTFTYVSPLTGAEVTRAGSSVFADLNNGRTRVTLVGNIF